VGPDNFYEVTQGGWYGYPDYFGGTPVADETFAVPGRPAPQALLQDPPELASQPIAQLDTHSASNGFDFASGTSFGQDGNAFIAQFGDLTPPTAGGVVAYAGQQVVMVTPEGEVQPFLTNPPGGDGRPLFRPTDAKFSTDGNSLYVVHFGQMTAVPGGVAPVPGTGALIRVTPAGG
jgi:glucose/arabinose dehydrogenase